MTDNFRFGTDGNDFLSGNNDNDNLFGRAGNDNIVGQGGNDNLFGESGDDVLGGDGYASRGNDYLFGGDGNDNLGGDFGNDILDAGNGNDRLNGAASIYNNPSTARSRGSGEIDVLIGGAGEDTFVLNSYNAAYGDPTAGNGPSYRFQGNNDYALITDFNKSEDFIELRSKETGPRTVTVEYSLGATPEGVPQGIGIYVNNLGAQPDLIAILPGVDPNSLSLSEPYFKFV